MVQHYIVSFLQIIISIEQLAVFATCWAVLCFSQLIDTCPSGRRPTYPATVYENTFDGWRPIHLCGRHAPPSAILLPPRRTTKKCRVLLLWPRRHQLWRPAETQTTMNRLLESQQRRAVKWRPAATYKCWLQQLRTTTTFVAVVAVASSLVVLCKSQ